MIVSYQKGTRPRVLVTGGAGFIGFHLCRRLLADGWDVTSVDGMTPYYDPALKRARHDLLRASNAFQAREILLEDEAALAQAYDDARPDLVVHLAAQAGVRYSIENPRAYLDANLAGTFNLLELIRAHRPGHVMFASTSSVYGANTSMPFRETDRTDHPLTLYAATKKAGEAMLHAYAHLWSVPTTCFRFFTVYGPWGRPDMALFKFVRAIRAGEPIDVYGEGRMTRDFTYVDDLVEAIARLALRPPGPTDVVAGDSLSPAAPWRVVNIGGGQPVGLMDFVRAIELALDCRAEIRLLPMQPGDVRETAADAALLEALIGYVPQTPVTEGVGRFVDWFVERYG